MARWVEIWWDYCGGDAIRVVTEQDDGTLAIRSSGDPSAPAQSFSSYEAVSIALTDDEFERLLGRRDLEPEYAWRAGQIDQTNPSVVEAWLSGSDVPALLRLDAFGTARVYDTATWSVVRSGAYDDVAAALATDGYRLVTGRMTPVVPVAA